MRGGMKMTIAFLGDSITCGYALEDGSKKYSTLVCAELSMEELNYGITGTLVAKAGLNQTNAKDYLSRAHLIDDADIAVVFGGTNDYFWSDRPISGCGEEYFAYAVKELVRRVKEKRGGKITLFVTPYPHNGVGNYLGGADWKDSTRHDTSAVNYNGHVLQDYAETIERICTEEGVPCLNLFEDFGFRWQEHTIDGCHPNEAGHALIAKAVLGELKKML